MSNFYGSITYYDNNLVIYSDSNIIWSTYTEEQKENLLKYLSKKLDRSYKWVGMKTSINQKLEFPRNLEEIYYRENLEDIYFKNNNTIPDELLECMLDLINNHINPDRFADLYSRGVRSINDSIINVSLDKPNDEKTIRYYVDEHLNKFTLWGYTHYMKSLDLLW